MRNFKELDVWKLAFEICTDVYSWVNGLPTQYKWSLGSQLLRAALSIPSNIAEGSGRRTEKEYSRFIDIANGSAFELETQLLLAKAIQVGNQDVLQTILEKLKKEERMLFGFSKVLNVESSKH
jgi:four helix bundle protein